MKIPPKIQVANTPTPIYPLKRLNPDPCWSNLYIKRDDFTGFEMGGNKVRKFEHFLWDAKQQGAAVLITCGDLQSNHARAAASLAAQYGLRCHLVLSGTETEPDGNYFYDRLFGAGITLLPPEVYEAERDRTMNELAQTYRNAGIIPYIMPTGGSNGLGMFGYVEAYLEIVRQERESGLTFDCICVTDGSGSTYAGLYFANEYFGGGKHIVGINVTGGTNSYKKRIGILDEGAAIAGTCAVAADNMHLIFDYLGEGYGKASQELLDFISLTAQKTGIIVDPVYVGKGLMGTISEISGHNCLLKGNVLFIHTGGQIGLFPFRNRFYFAE